MLFKSSYIYITGLVNLTSGLFLWDFIPHTLSVAIRFIDSKTETPESLLFQPSRMATAVTSVANRSRMSSRVPSIIPPNVLCGFSHASACIQEKAGQTTDYFLVQRFGTG